MLSKKEIGTQDLDMDVKGQLRKLENLSRSVLQTKVQEVFMLPLGAKFHNS